MEGTYDDDFHRDQGYDTFDDWLAAQPDRDCDYDYDLNQKETFRDFLKNFELRKCSNNLCQGRFVLKFNKLKNSLFWGCSSFPKCKHTTSIMGNIETITKCENCGSLLKVDKIISCDKISLKCINIYCKKVTFISEDDYFSDPE